MEGALQISGTATQHGDCTHTKSFSDCFTFSPPKDVSLSNETAGKRTPEDLAPSFNQSPSFLGLWCGAGEVACDSDRKENALRSLERKECTTYFLPSINALLQDLKQPKYDAVYRHAHRMFASFQGTGKIQHQYIVRTRLPNIGSSYCYDWWHVRAKASAILLESVMELSQYGYNFSLLRDNDSGREGSFVTHFSHSLVRTFGYVLEIINGRSRALKWFRVFAMFLNRHASSSRFGSSWT